MNATLSAAGRAVVAFAVVALLAPLACSSSEPAVSSDAGSACVLRDGACSEGCCPQSGLRFDEERQCLAGRFVIGCAPRPASTNACVFQGVVGCAVAPAGTFVTTDLAAGWTPPTACSDALRAKVLAANSCGDAGL